MLTPEQIAIRKGRYGSSSVAALLIDPETGRSISPFSSPLREFQRQLGLKSTDEEGSDHRAWGSVVEASILDDWSAQIGLPIWRPRVTVPDLRNPLACASPDGIAIGNGTLVNTEAKNVGRWMAGAWDAEDDSDAGVPIYYAAQCIWQVGVMRNSDMRAEDGSSVAEMLSPLSDLVASIEGARPRRYVVPFDGDTFGYMLDVVAKFDRDHVKTGKPPAGWESEGARALEYVGKRWAKSQGRMIEASGADMIMWEELKRMKVAEKTAAGAVNKWRSLLSERIGDADGIAGADGKPIVTRKSTKDGLPVPVCNWEGAMRSLATLVQDRAPELAGAMQEIVNANISSVAKKGHRVFLVKGMPKGEE